MAGRRSNLAQQGSNATSESPSNNNGGTRRRRSPGPSSRSGSKSSGASSQSKSTNFNPRLIFSQIVALQCFHYLILGFIFQCNHVLFSTSVTVDRIFTTKYLNLWSLRGWADNSAILLSSFIGALLLAIIVEKAKKCLDFSVTLFFIHLSVCTAYAGLPSTWDWWIIHVLGTLIMILLGEYLCSRRELSEIPLLVI